MHQTLEIVTDCIGILMISFGLVFFLGGAVGLMRFPDFYSRMHAAGKGDTLSTLLMVSGFAFCHVDEIYDAIGTDHWHEPILLIAKMFAISVLIMITSPTSTHALIEAGYEDGIEPVVERDELKTAREAGETE
jgi:multicomponent Na+:H+ antiporter subunit G